MLTQKKYFTRTSHSHQMLSRSVGLPKVNIQIILVEKKSTIINDHKTIKVKEYLTGSFQYKDEPHRTHGWKKSSYGLKSFCTNQIEVSGDYCSEQLDGTLLQPGVLSGIKGSRFYASDRHLLPAGWVEPCLRKLHPFVYMQWALGERWEMIVMRSINYLDINKCYQLTKCIFHWMGTCIYYIHLNNADMDKCLWT